MTGREQRIRDGLWSLVQAEMRGVVGQICERHKGALLDARKRAEITVEVAAALDPMLGPFGIEVAGLELGAGSARVVFQPRAPRTPEKLEVEDMRAASALARGVSA